MTMNSLNYEGKTALVTGCSSGIGNATCDVLSTLNAHVIGVDHVPPSTTNVAEFIPADLRAIASIDRALAALNQPIDVLINCAGVSPTQPAEQIVRVNFIGTRYLTEGIARTMRSGSAIVNVGSIGGAAWSKHVAQLLEFLRVDDPEAAWRWYEAHGEFAQDAYCFSKEAIVVWTKQLAATAIERGIRVNCTAPGSVQTPMLTDIENNLPGANVDRVTHPIGRRSSPEEQAWALVFLGSSMAAYINGVDLAVDGGAISTQLIGGFGG